MKITINQNPAIREPEVIINCREVNARIRNLTDSIRQYSMTLAGEIAGMIYYVPLETVIYIESANKKTFFYDCSRVFQSRDTLSGLEDCLGNVHFIRISKYCIVNLAKIEGIRSCGNHRLELTMVNGERLLTGRVYQKNFLKNLDIFHMEKLPLPYIKTGETEAEPLYAAQRCVYNEGCVLSFPESPHRTAALSYGAAELLCALGLGDRLAAVAPAEDVLEHTLPEFRETISKIPLLKNKGNGIPAMPDLEILGIDLVICSWYYPQMLKQETRTSYKLPVYITESTVPEKAGMEQLYRDILNLGRIFRVEDRAICFAEQIRLKIAALNRRVSRKKPVRVFVYDSGEAEPWTALRGTLEHDLISLAGGTNVFGNQEGSYRAVSWQKAGDTKPEVIVVHDYPDSMSMEEKLEYLKQRPELLDSPDLATSIGSIRAAGELLRVGLPVIFFGVVYGGSRAVADSLAHLYADRAAQTDRLALSRAIFSMDNANFAGKDTGEYLNMATADVLLIRDQYYLNVPLIFCYVAQFVFCVGYSLLLNPVVGAVLMVLSAVQYSVPAVYAEHMDRRMVEQSRKTAGFTSKWKELLLGFSVIKSYGTEKNAQAEFGQADEEMTQARVRAAVLSRMMGCSNLGVGWIMVTVAVVLAGYFVITGDMAAGTLLTVFYIANRYSMPAMDFSAAWASIKGSRGMREKLAAFLRKHPEKAESESRTIQKDVEVRNLSFSYDGDIEALRQVSFRFEAGKKYLLLGESGCGKSTLLKLLAGQFPARGIYIDGVPAETLPVGTLRGKMILVGQQSYVFRRTVAENIDFVGTGNRKQVLEAAEQCCMTEFLTALPQGIDTLVDEEQRQLSGGQKARIGLARALYTRPDVLLLDEVTSALDPETALQIEQMLLDLEGVMVIHVAHKPAKELMERYDAVLLMEDGRIRKAASV